MSSDEAGVDIVGLISGVISIIEAAKTVYDAAGDTTGYPDAFRQVAARLPLVIDILRSAEKITPEPSEITQEELDLTLKFLKAYKANAKKLLWRFQEAFQKNDDMQFDQLEKASRRLGWGDGVEYIMEMMLQDIQLPSGIIMGDASAARYEELEEGIEVMREIYDSDTRERYIVGIVGSSGLGEFGTRDSRDGQTPLLRGIMNELLGKDASVNATDNGSRIPPHNACYSGLEQMMDELLSKKASVNGIDKDGRTPHHVVGSRKLSPLGVSSCNIGYYGLSVSYTP